MSGFENVRLTRLPPDMQPGQGYESFNGPEQFGNVPADPYLSSQSAMDADMYLEPSNNNNSYVRDKQGTTTRNSRGHDSGILDEQADVDSLTATTPRTSSTNVSTPSPPALPYMSGGVPLPPAAAATQPPMLSRRPDSLGLRAHEYEELPGQKYSHFPYTDRGAQPTPPKLHALGSISETQLTSGSNGSMMSDKPPLPVGYRKRHNPLYDDEKASMVPKKPARHRRKNCCCFAAVVFSIITLINFVLLILLLTEVLPIKSGSDQPETGASTSDHNQNKLNGELKERIRDLEEKVKSLEAAGSHNYSRVVSMVDGLQRDVVQLKGEIDTVSKMEGPRGFNGSRGPPGAGDLSQCSYDVRTGRGAPGSMAETPWYPPSATQFQDRVVTGAHCTIEDPAGGGAILETKTLQGSISYRCVCHGRQPQQNSPPYLTCLLHFWSCPKNS